MAKNTQAKKMLTQTGFYTYTHFYIFLNILCTVLVILLVLSNSCKLASSVPLSIINKDSILSFIHLFNHNKPIDDEYLCIYDFNIYMYNK